MKTSESIAAISAALSKAQGQMSPAIKDSTNPHFRSTYADLASVWDACRGPLSANGLSVVQIPEELDNGRISIQTMLTHSSGEYICGTLVIPVGKNDAQGVGSAISYGRRYALASMVGITQADDDGNAASEAPKAKAAKIKVVKDEPESIESVMKRVTDSLTHCKNIATLAAAYTPAVKEVRKHPDFHEPLLEELRNIKDSKKAQLEANLDKLPM